MKVIKTGTTTRQGKDNLSFVKILSKYKLKICTCASVRLPLYIYMLKINSRLISVDDAKRLL